MKMTDNGMMKDFNYTNVGKYVAVFIIGFLLGYIVFDSMGDKINMNYVEALIYNVDDVEKVAGNLPEQLRLNSNTTLGEVVWMYDNFKPLTTFFLEGQLRIMCGELI